MNHVRLIMWNKLKAILSPFETDKVEKAPEPESPDEDEFTPTPNTELRLKGLKLSEDKVQRIFMDFAFRLVIRDYYSIMNIRAKEMKDKEEFLPEELEHLKDEYQIISLILEFERKDFISRCTMNHLDLLRKIAKEIIKLNPMIDKNKNPDLEVYWLDNKAKLLEPFDLRLNLIKTKVFNQLKDAGILTEEEPKTVTTGTTDTTPPGIAGPDSDDIVMDGGTGKTEEKKSTMNFN